MGVTVFWEGVCAPPITPVREFEVGVTVEEAVDAVSWEGVFVELVVVAVAVAGVTGESNGPMEGRTGVEDVIAVLIIGGTILSIGIAPNEIPIGTMENNRMIKTKLFFFFKGERLFTVLTHPADLITLKFSKENISTTIY